VQPILDGPRQTLTAPFVRSLLQSQNTIQIKFGAFGLDENLAEVGDLSGYMQSGSSISSDVTNTVHRTCSLKIDADAVDIGWSYLSGFIRPYMDFIDVSTQKSARFHLGVYTLTTPQRVLGTSPAVLDFAGFDLVYLLRLPIGDSYEVAAGSDPAQAAADAISAAVPSAQVNYAPSGASLPGQLSWPFDAANPVTWYDVVTTLLDTIGYRQVWVDWEGVFRVEPFLDVQDVTPEWKFDTLAPDNIVADGGTQDVDIYNVPNWWRFVMADLTASPVEGITQFTWEDSSAINPGSTQNRGRTQKKIVSVSAVSYDDLVNFAQKTIVNDLAPAETFSVSTQPFPIAWHLDVIEYIEETLDQSLPVQQGTTRRVLATAWTLPLDGQSDMSWTWQTISDQTATIGLTVLT
jgi:hypothetical protein